MFITHYLVCIIVSGRLMLECKENQLQTCRVNIVKATVRLYAPSSSLCFWSDFLTDRLMEWTVWPFVPSFNFLCVVLHTFHLNMPSFQTRLDTVFEYIFLFLFFFFFPTNMYCLFGIFMKCTFIHKCYTFIT